jgi:hypothetical protein
MASIQEQLRQLEGANEDMFDENARYIYTSAKIHWAPLQTKKKRHLLTETQQ